MLNRIKYLSFVDSSESEDEDLMNVSISDISEKGDDVGFYSNGLLECISRRLLTMSRLYKSSNL